VFGPDPAGPLAAAAAYFILVALAATAGQLVLASLVLRLCCARTPATSE
jgi:hypothetical protein